MVPSGLNATDSTQLVWPVSTATAADGEVTGVGDGEPAADGRAPGWRLPRTTAVPAPATTAAPATSSTRRVVRRAGGEGAHGRVHGLSPSAEDRGQAAYGQAETLVTPLQMALVAATVANDGVERKIDRTYGG